MIDITENKRSVEPWQELENFEADILQKYCTGILAKMISINISDGLNANIDKYWNAINKNSELVYITTYNQRGTIDQNKNLYMDKAIVDDALWSKSLTTKTFFKQEITYDQNKVIDIANPLFNNISWVGILKVGIAK